MAKDPICGMEVDPKKAVENIDFSDVLCPTLRIMIDKLEIENFKSIKDLKASGVISVTRSPKERKMRGLFSNSPK